MDLLFADQVADGGRGDHDLQRHHAAAPVRGGDELLRENTLEHEGKLGPHLGLLGGGEDVDDAVDGLRAGVGVQGPQRQVARLCDGEGGRDGLEVAHLAHEDHVGILAEDVLERVLEGVRVREDLALVHQALLVVVDELDGILDGHDVLGPLVVDLVHHGGQGGGLARARGPRDEDESLGPVGELLDHGGQPQLVEGADLDGDDADGRGHRAALAVDVAAEAGETLDAEGEVELVVLLELLLLPLVQHAIGEPLGVLGRQALELGQRGQLAVQPDLGRSARGDVQVGCPAFDHDGQKIVHRGGHGYAISSVGVMYRASRAALLRSSCRRRSPSAARFAGASSCPDAARPRRSRRRERSG